jgi:NADH:ubiquinone oxidoreductase subunit D
VGTVSWLTRELQRFLIALLVLALFAGAVIIMTFVIVPPENRDAVIQLVGGVNTLAGLVIGYYFGKAVAEAAPPAN